jgi:hypothetical protein
MMLAPVASALPAAFSHFLSPDATLAEAIGDGVRAAVIPVRHRLMTQAEAELAFVRVQLRALRLMPSVDRRLVSFEASEEFRTADIYRVLRSSGCIVPHQELNWENFAPPRVRMFFWILRLGKTRTRAHLSRLGCVPSPDCPFCPGHREDVRHLFVQCPRLAGVWELAAPGLRLPPSSSLLMLVDGLAEHLRGMQPSPRNTVVLSLLWAVWKSRNRMVFDRELLSATQVASMAADHLRLWVVHAPPCVDLALLHSWCDSVS